MNNDVYILSVFININALDDPQNKEGKTMAKDYRKLCGDRIKAKRTDLSMTSRELAKNVGLTEAAVGAYQRYENFPQPDGMEKLSKTLDTDMAYLAGYDDHEFLDVPFHQRMAGQYPAFKVRRALLSDQGKQVIQYQCQQNSYGLQIGDMLLINTACTHGDGLFLIDDQQRPAYIHEAPQPPHTVGKIIASFHLYD